MKFRLWRLSVLVVASLIALTAGAGCATDADSLNEPPKSSVDVPAEIEHVVGDIIKITVTAEDPEDDALTFHLLQGPERAQFQTFNRWAVFTWDPVASDVTGAEPSSLIFAVRDSAGNETQNVVKVRIRNGNGIPVFLSDSSILYNVASEKPVAFDVRVRDDDSSSVAIRMDRGPAGAELTRTGDFTGRFGWDPSQEQLRQRVHSVVFIADDGQNDPVEQTVTIVIKKEQKNGGIGDEEGGETGGEGGSCTFESAVSHVPPTAQRTTTDYRIEALLTAEGAQKYDGIVLNWTTGDPFNQLDLEWNSTSLIEKGGKLVAEIPNQLLDSGEAIDVFYELCAVDSDAAEGDPDSLLCGPTSLYYSFTAYAPDNQSCIDPLPSNSSFEDAADISTVAWTMHRMCSGEDNYFKLGLGSGSIADVFFTYPLAQRPDIELLDADQNPVGEIFFSDCSGYALAALDNPGGPTVNYFRVSGNDVPVQVSAFLGASDPSACTDADMEPNDTADDATVVTTPSATLEGLEICQPSDADVFAIDAAEGDILRLQATFTHDMGDLDMMLFAPSERANVSEDGVGTDFGFSVSDNESIEHVARETGTYYLVVYTMDSPNTYSLGVEVEAGSTTDCVDSDAFTDNHSKQTAQTLTFQPHHNLTVCPLAPDWYQFFTFSNEEVHVELTVTDGDMSDVTATVWGPNDVVVGTLAEDNGKLILVFTAGSAADHYLQVETLSPVTYSVDLYSDFI